MMEGIYFFGEHVRWNLGWNNPNPAGAFVAMWVPWLWGLGCWAANGAPKQQWLTWLILLGELVLWFLLCKTYSRGALVALGASGLVFMLVSWVAGLGPLGRWTVAARGAAIIGLLVATGFFSRIDPRFVSTDASAGNRLVLWKGGLQMIAVSPWRGWGKGESGPGFMNWFQSLDAEEAYAGMVNSYLHVGVEYGLPVLAASVALAAGFCVVSGMSIRRVDGGRSGLRFMQMAAGCSLFVFLIANVFSTLWIFENLWWLPIATCLWIAGGAMALYRGRFIRVAGISLGAGGLCSIVFSGGLWMAGKVIPADVRVSLEPNGRSISCSSVGKVVRNLWFFPDKSVLGECWGKEVRRLVLHDRGVKAYLPRGRGAGRVTTALGDRPQGIVACGGSSEEGFSALLRFPNARLLLVHPLGKPVIPDGIHDHVSVILPMLDTSGRGRVWRRVCKKRGWKCMISPGVGQDARLLWPKMVSERY